MSEIHTAPGGSSPPRGTGAQAPAKGNWTVPRFLMVSLIGLVWVGGLCLVGLLVFYFLPPHVPCDQTGPSTVRLIARIKEVIPALLVPAYVVVCGLLARRHGFQSVAWFYLVLSVIAVVGLVWWIVFVFNDATLGQPVLCDLAP
jgi:hypothetical protein